MSIFPRNISGYVLLLENFWTFQHEAAGIWGFCSNMDQPKQRTIFCKKKLKMTSNISSSTLIPKKIIVYLPETISWKTNSPWRIRRFLSGFGETHPIFRGCQLPTGQFLGVCNFQHPCFGLISHQASTDGSASIQSCSSSVSVKGFSQATAALASARASMARAG